MLTQGADRRGFRHLDTLAVRQHRDKAQIRRAEVLADLDLELGGTLLARLQ